MTQIDRNNRGVRKNMFDQTLATLILTRGMGGAPGAWSDVC